MKNISLHEDIQIVLSNRHNGVSCDNFASLNIASHVGDKSSHVEKNRAIFANYFDGGNLIFMNQIHSDNVQIINNITQTNVSADAILSNKKSLILCVVVADCIPIVLYDKKNKVVAIIHAGRAGCFLNIIAKTLQTLNQNFKTVNSDILVYIGPFIGKCCYQISNEILKEAKSNFSYALNEKDGKYFLDIGEIAKKQLIENGILSKNILFENVCTCCDKNFFSYRRDGKCGRFAVGVKIL